MVKLGEMHPQIVHLAPGHDSGIGEGASHAVLEVPDEAGCRRSLWVHHTAEESIDEHASVFGRDAPVRDQFSDDVLDAITSERGGANRHQDRLLNGISK